MDVMAKRAELFAQPKEFRTVGRGFFANDDGHEREAVLWSQSTKGG